MRAVEFFLATSRAIVIHLYLISIFAISSLFSVNAAKLFLLCAKPLPITKIFFSFFSSLSIRRQNPKQKQLCVLNGVSSKSLPQQIHKLIVLQPPLGRNYHLRRTLTGKSLYHNILSKPLHKFCTEIQVLICRP